jgi:hypothetical protein
MTQKQVAATKMVSCHRWNAFLSGKNRTNATRFHRLEDKKAPAAAGQGLF